MCLIVQQLKITKKLICRKKLVTEKIEDIYIQHTLTSLYA